MIPMLFRVITEGAYWGRAPAEALAGLSAIAAAPYSAAAAATANGHSIVASSAAAGSHIRGFASPAYRLSPGYVHECEHHDCRNMSADACFI